MSETNTIIRWQIADYLNVGNTGTPEYDLMGLGYNTLDENPQAQTDTKAYISDTGTTTVIKGYQKQFPFDTDFIKGVKSIQKIYSVGRNELTGSDAEVDYVRVELFDPVDDGSGLSENVYAARKFRCAVEVSNITGSGAEVVKMTGSLNNVGQFVDGTFDTTTRTFTPCAK